MSDQDHRKLMEELTKESVRLQKWQMALSVILGVLALFGVYLTQSSLVLLMTAIIVVLVLTLIAIMFSPESDDSFWMEKVSAANDLRLQYLAVKEDSPTAASSFGSLYRGALEKVYGYAVISGKRSAADYFKRLIDEYDSTLSHDRK